MRELNYILLRLIAIAVGSFVITLLLLLPVMIALVTL